jgi:hypothetical protein
MRFLTIVVATLAAGCASRLSGSTDDALVRDFVTIREFDGHAGFGTQGGMRSYGWEAKDELVARGPASVAALTAALRDLSLDAEQRSLVRLALSEMGPRAAPAVPALLDELARADARTAADICRDLGGIGAGAVEAVPALLQVLRERGDEVARPSVSAGGSNVTELRLRTSVALALGGIGPRADAALLVLADGAAQSVDAEYGRACRTAIRAILGPEPTVAR